MSDFLHFVFPGLPVSKEKQIAREIIAELKGGEGSGNFGHAGRPGEVGGSAGEGQPAGRRSRISPERRAELDRLLGDEDEAKKWMEEWNKPPSEESYQKIKDAEKELIGRDTERGLIFDKDGNLLSSTDGTRGSVSFTEVQLIEARNGVITHNHPEGKSFSAEDFKCAANAQLYEIRVVTNEGVYSATRPKTGWIGYTDINNYFEAAIDSTSEKYGKMNELNTDNFVSSVLDDFYSRISPIEITFTRY